MTLTSKKSIVPQELQLNGDTLQEFFVIKNALGAKVMTIYGDGRITYAQGAQGAALTAATVAPASFTHQAVVTPDYAIANLINSNAYGFASADEGNSVLAVLKNAITRIAEIEAVLEANGLVAAN